MSDTPQVLLAHHLKTLKLPTFLREYDLLARQCVAEGVDHVRYLVRLSELELIDRERQMTERRIRIYVRLAHHEEQEALSAFGIDYVVYAERVSGFIPNFNKLTLGREERKP